jgi:hypothetical protein
MTYIIFEGGSRCALSAYMFIMHANKELHKDDKVLFVDSNELVGFTTKNLRNSSFITQDEFYENIDKFSSDEYKIFPADELNRQSNSTLLSRFGCSVNPEWYSKSYVNGILESLNLTKLNIPKTIYLKNALIKPDSHSAGSKGLIHCEHACISEEINIKNEYVVDCTYTDGELRLSPREVKLRSGYDQYIRFLTTNEFHEIFEMTNELVELTRSTPLSGLFNNIFHIQLMKDHNDKYYFIEASNRISGSSLVNLVIGFNPLIKLFSTYVNDNQNDWHQYDQLIYELGNDEIF